MAPVSAFTVLSFEPAKKPIAWPSGAQNGNVAPSVPASVLPSPVDRSRNQSRDVSPAKTTAASRRPSGETASGASTPVVVVAAISVCVTRLAARQRDAYIAAAIAAATARVQPMAADNP